MPGLRNWAESFEYGAARVLRPRSVEELQEMVRRSSKCKALGSRHSFGEIADTDGDLISMEALDGIESIDAEQMMATVQGGASYGLLCSFLCEAGLALPNLASLPHISVAGACATATHGSGVGNKCLSASVSAMEVVRADGELVRLERGDADFQGTVVHLGALGIVLRLTLDLVPSFTVRQYVFEDLPFDEVLEGFDEIMSSAYSVSLFTDWSGPKVNQVWVKSLSEYSAVFGARPAGSSLHPIQGMPAENCTAQMGEEGAWHERLPHFRMAFTPSSGEELQSEYLVPWERTASALRAVSELGPAISPHLHISEVRSIAQDDLWMSPFDRQPCAGIHFTWKKDWAAVAGLLPLIESALEPLGARPHWGKLFSMDPRPGFAKLGEFQELARRFDPAGKFRNRFLERWVL